MHLTLAWIIILLGNLQWICKGCCGNAAQLKQLVLHCKWTVTFILTNFDAQNVPLQSVLENPPLFLLFQLLILLSTKWMATWRACGIWGIFRNNGKLAFLLLAFRLLEGGATHSMAFSSLMGIAALSILHRWSRIIACGRREKKCKNMCETTMGNSCYHNRFL